MISSASLIAESNYYQEAGRKSSISDGPFRKISTSSIEKKVSFDRGVSIQEEEDTKPEEEPKMEAETASEKNLVGASNVVADEATHENAPQ